ncbi:MAG: transglycosylase SLT domain-containing protein [Bdellovibrionaceae bacterium]|nr:transglycosylase SLT domain-containing protein [Bdellovibrionales bacterium]MCB9084391.1 transglycosylase SLT domain-containing protein [Pseudobdellovibrionaceae bacterium]
MRLRLCLLALLAALVFEGIAQGQSNLRPLTLTSDLDLPTSRWIYDKAPLSKKSTKVVRLLRQLKEEEEKEAGKKCLDTVAALNRQAKSFRPWLVVTELRCAVMVAKGKERRYLTLVQALAKVDSNSSWLLHGPQVPSLREAYVEALMNLLKKELKANRRQAWKTIDRLNKIKGWLNKSQVGELYRYAGELAFIQQNLSLALDYYTRSFDVDPLSSVQKRLDSLKASLAKGKPGPPEPTVEVSPADVLEASGEENELYERIKTALGAGDLVAAVEDSVKLMEEFPGGRRSDWASDRVFEILSNLLSKSDSKYRLLKERVMDPMLKVAPGRQGEWARRLFYSGYYLESLQLAEAAFSQQKGRDAANPLLTAGQSAVYLGDYKRAGKHFEKLVQQHGGTEEAAEGLFRLGMVYLRQQKYSAGVAAFERLLALPQGSKWELQSRYWMWRGLEKTSVERAKEEGVKLIERYPLTYYGLRARAEQNGGQLEFPKDSKGPIKVDLWLTESESLAWERLQIFLKAGWLDEAQAEVSQLPPPQTAEEKVVYARLYGLAFDHFKAIALVNEAWDQDTETQRPAIYPISYPREFVGLIKKNADKEKLDANLVLALIKQESSFRPKALSPAQAAGLMQIVPITARDSAQYLKWKKRMKLPEDLFSPELNIYFGTSYLKRMVRAFDKHVPLALAAYNLGIGRLRKWLSNREDLNKLSETGSDDPFDGLWIDELPWVETSYYVKAVMRNYLIYQTLESGKVELGNPLWRNAAE